MQSSIPNKLSYFEFEWALCLCLLRKHTAMASFPGQDYIPLFMFIFHLHYFILCFTSLFTLLDPQIPIIFPGGNNKNGEIESMYVPKK